MAGKGCPPGSVAVVNFENSNHRTGDPVYGRADATGAYGITIRLPDTTDLPYSVSAFCQEDISQTQINTMVWLAK